MTLTPVPVDEVKQREDLIKSMTDKYNQIGQEGFLINKMMDQETKTGRNNRCHCGSGRKYKMCCMFLYEEKRSRLIEIAYTLTGIAEDIKNMHKEIAEVKKELEGAKVEV